MLIQCTGCEDRYGAHEHCPFCENYGLNNTHDNACPASHRRPAPHD